MLAVSWQPPQKRKSGLLAELLILKPSGPVGTSWHADHLRRLRGRWASQRNGSQESGVCEVGNASSPDGFSFPPREAGVCTS